jgi:serine/threonine protein kinase
MATEPDLSPSRVAHYEIILPIASGGSATVYLARSLLDEKDLEKEKATATWKKRRMASLLHRYVALKLTSAHLRNDRTYSKLLLEEAKLSKNLRHPNVVEAFDMGDSDEGVFLVMEYIPGDSLWGLSRHHAKEEVGGGDLPQGIALKILIDALHGLHAAHEHKDETGRPLNIVHRDFTPHNILVGTDGIGRLTDFGIAKASSRASTTETGFTKGKLQYLAPEQVGDGTPCDRRCDLWSAGVIAWEILTKTRLYSKDDKAVLDPKREDPPRVKTIAPAISQELDDLVARALRVDRDHRISSARDLANELNEAAKKANLLASQDEAAKLVVKLVSAELIERRELLDEARKEREKRPVSAPDVRTMIGMQGPLVQKRPPLPSLPELPTIEDDGHSELRIAVNLKSDAERADLGELGVGDAAAPVSEPDPEVFKSPVVLESERTLAATEAKEKATAKRRRASSHNNNNTNNDDGDNQDKDRSSRASSPLVVVLDRVKPWVSPPWTTQKISVLTAAGGVFLGFIIVLIVASGGKKPDPSDPTTTKGTGAASAGSSAVTIAPDVPSPSGSSSSSSDVSPDETAVLQVKANAPIQSVTVIDRYVDAVVPTQNLNVDLEESERDKMLRLTVTGTDGRTAMATVEPGVREVSVTFESKPKRPATPPTTTGTTKHPWSSTKKK